jgi:hypothetical protein
MLFRYYSNFQTDENIDMAKWLCKLCDDYFMISNKTLINNLDYYYHPEMPDYYSMCPYNFHIKCKLDKIKEGLIKPIIMDELMDCPICFDTKGRMLKLECNNYICFDCLEHLNDGNTAYKNKCCMCTKVIDYNKLEYLEVKDYKEEKKSLIQKKIVKIDHGFIDD